MGARTSTEGPIKPTDYVGVSHLKTLPKGKVNLIESSAEADMLSRVSDNFSPISIETKKKPESVIFEDEFEA